MLEKADTKIMPINIQTADKPIRILIVDDAAAFRSIIKHSLSKIEGVEIVAAVCNGKMALDKIKETQIDLMTLDMEMPVMNGIETIQELATYTEKPSVLIISSTQSKQTEMAIKAMSLGALDVLAKPSGKSAAEDLRSHLEKTVKAVRIKRKYGPSTKLKPQVAAPSPSPKKPKVPFLSPTLIEAVVIGSSTGGPAALLEVVSKLPESFPVPILIVQHLPAGFSAALAKSLDTNCALPVHEAEDRMLIEKGHIYLAPGGKHMIVHKNALGQAVIKLTDTQTVRGVKPSVDVLLDSISYAYKPSHCIITILTGMGSDGADGVEKLKPQGCYVVCQNQASCTVWGMPRAVEERQLADDVLDLKEITPKLSGLLGIR